MKFSNQTTGIARIGDQLRYEGSILRKRVVSIARIACATWVEPGHNTGSARGANRALAIRVGKTHAGMNEAIQRRRSDMRVSQRADGIKALLIGAVPKDIGSFHGDRRAGWRFSGSKNQVLRWEQTGRIKLNADRTS